MYGTFFHGDLKPTTDEKVIFSGLGLAANLFVVNYSGTRLQIRTDSDHALLNTVERSFGGSVVLSKLYYFLEFVNVEIHYSESRVKKEVGEGRSLFLEVFTAEENIVSWFTIMGKLFNFVNGVFRKSKRRFFKRVASS